jgi:hypothetical protein
LLWLSPAAIRVNERTDFGDAVDSIASLFYAALSFPPMILFDGEMQFAVAG